MKERLFNGGKTLEDLLAEGYVVAKDEDFEEKSYYNICHWAYIGNDEYIIIPYTIQGENIVSYESMFSESEVKGVASNNPNIIHMGRMFRDFKGDSLDLRYLSTSSVKNINCIFWNTEATEIIGLEDFDISNVEVSGSCSMTPILIKYLKDVNKKSVKGIINEVLSKRDIEFEVADVEPLRLADINIIEEAVERQNGLKERLVRLIDLELWDTVALEINDALNGWAMKKVDKLYEIEKDIAKVEKTKRYENILKNVKIKKLSNENQYIVKDASLINFNKLPAIDFYKLEKSIGNYKLTDIIIEKEIHFYNEDDFNHFNNMLLYEYNFLKLSNFLSVYLNQELQYIIETEGYEYVRGIAFTDKSKID